MKLTLEQMKEITLGALNIEVNAAGEFCFYRFTEHQMEDVYIEIPDFYKKATAAAGIRLDFITDSETLSFRYTIKSGSSRKFYFFDCCVDGVMIAHEGEMEMFVDRGFWGAKFELKSDYVKMYEYLIPKLVKKEYPQTFYCYPALQNRSSWTFHRSLTLA